MMTPALRLALFQPLPLLVLLTAILAGLFVAIWLLPLGIVAYAAMVWLRGRDSDLIAEAARPVRPRLTSDTFRSQLEAIERTAQEIGRSGREANGPLQRLLAPIAQQARDLVDESYVLCDKGQLIESYLGSIDRRALDTRIKNTNQQIGATADAYTRDQLTETRKALEEKLQNARDLDTFTARIRAQLQNIGATLDNVLAETVRLRTADAAAADVATSQVAQRLNDIKADMSAFQQVLDTAITQTGTP